MNSVVCISHVPDTEARIKVGADAKRIDESGLKFIVSPYDEYALEHAIRLKEAAGGDVTVVAYGPDRVQQALRECLARGATKALHIKGETADVDALGIAKVLYAAVKELPHDVVFFGKQGVGTDNSLVGPMFAELAGVPQLNVVTDVKISDGKAVAHREIEGGEEVLEVTLPAVITAQKSKAEPRYASLKGIMAAKKIPIDVKSVADLGLDEGDIVGRRVRWVALEMPPEKAAGRKIDGADPAEAAREILRYIREEAKAF